MVNDLPKEYLEVIGAISIDFAFLERMLIRIISQSAGANIHVIERLVVNDSFEVLLFKFKKLFIFRYHYFGLDKDDKELIKEFDSLIDCLYTINRRRNKLIHAIWLTDKNGQIVRHKYRRSIKKDPSIDDRQTITLEYFKDFLKEIYDNTILLLRFKRKIIKLFSVLDSEIRNIIYDYIKDKEK